LFVSSAVLAGPVPGELGDQRVVMVRPRGFLLEEMNLPNFRRQAVECLSDLVAYW
jgi:hypothetical protein